MYAHNFEFEGTEISSSPFKTESRSIGCTSSNWKELAFQRAFLVCEFRHIQPSAFVKMYTNLKFATQECQM